MQRLLSAGLFALLFTSPIAAQDVYRVSEQVTAPKKLSMPKLVYTEEAARKAITGMVTVEVDVLPDGTVATVALVKSLDPDLDKAVADAAKKATFTPGTKDGKPVAVRTTISIGFSVF